MSLYKVLSSGSRPIDQVHFTFTRTSLAASKLNGAILTVIPGIFLLKATADLKFGGSLLVFIERFVGNVSFRTLHTVRFSLSAVPRVSLMPS